MAEEIRERLLSQFIRSIGKLEEVLLLKKQEIVRDAAIQRFEFTFELTWKTIQRFLEKEGVRVNSPREAFRQAFKLGWIQDDPLWMEMIESRNLTVHTYDEATADKIYEALRGYLPLFQALGKKLQGL